ncbi:MAG: type pilus assembly protein PilA [Thermoanaerobaculia bacterium]|jgi:type IV fimbrial biogenesis protein FimT|nr:type pilus assembly protein PilA [Thermoanaerobaculia bacterium]
MRPRNIASRGYSLIEILVVVAIIGIMSMVTVPAFMNYQRAASLKATMRSFTSDIRNCRQRAISRNSQVRLELDSSNTYRFYEMPFSGTWGALNGFSGTGPGSNAKQLDSGVTFSSNTLGDLDSNSKKDLVFRPDGTVNLGTGTGTVTLQSPWKNIAQNQFLVTVTTSGKLTTAGSHT